MKQLAFISMVIAGAAPVVLGQAVLGQAVLAQSVLAQNDGPSRAKAGSGFKAFRGALRWVRSSGSDWIR